MDLLAFLLTPLDRPGPLADSFAYIVLDSLPLAAKLIWEADAVTCEAMWNKLAGYCASRTPCGAALAVFRATTGDADAVSSLFATIMACKDGGWDTSFEQSLLERHPKLESLAPRDLPGTVAVPNEPMDLRFPLPAGAPTWIFDDVTRDVEVSGVFGLLPDIS